jgi:hypothetical protein
MTAQEILDACAARDSHLTDADRLYLSGIRAKLDDGVELSERETRALDAFRKAVESLPTDQ